MSFDTLDLTILKSLITNKKHGLDFAAEYDAKLFSPEVWTSAQLIVSYLKTHKEPPTLRVLTERLTKSKATKQIDSLVVVWNAIEQTQIDSKEYKHDLERLKTRYAEKQLLLVRDGLSKLDVGQIDINKSMSDLQKTIQSIKSLDNKQAYEIKNIKDYLQSFVDRFNVKKNNPSADKGLLTKYSFLDYATNGLRPADFVVIAGESGFGKSLFLNNIAAQVWLQDNKIIFPTAENSNPAPHNFTSGKNIIFFSLEMPYEDCFHRLLSRISNVPSRKIENADLNREEFNRIKICLNFIKEYPYVFKIVDIADASANDLEAILAETNENFDAIFIDYLGIMRPNEKNEDQDWLKQGIVAYETRAISRKLNMPIFSAVQLNRKSQGKEASENIGLARLARSATIATHCTHVIQIETRLQEEKHPDLIFHLIKNRRGPKGKGILIKNLACAMLLDKNDGDQPYLNNEINDLFKDQDDISEELENLEL